MKSSPKLYEQFQEAFQELNRRQQQSSQEVALEVNSR